MTFHATGRSWRSLAVVLGLFLACSVAACGKTVRATIDDSTITTRVKTALLNEPKLSALQINVDTTEHIVTLSGSVRNPEERDRAVAVARATTGVADVRSELQVVP